MKHALILLFVLFAGCGTAIQIDRSLEPPELVSLAPLPPFRSFSFHDVLRIEVLLYVKKDGTVEDARFVGTSGDPDWDSLALQAIRRWRFTAARRDGEPTELWIHQQVRVQFQDPILMTLAELVSPDQRHADSLYELLTNGADFGTLAAQSRRTSPSDSNVLLSTVDITLFPTHVREALRKLVEGGFTTPLRVGDKYIIYKRFKKPVS